jgi:hypothetical protein
VSYRLTGSYYAPCSCEIGCPCNFGAPEGDDGYCSAALAVDIKSGAIDDVDVSGVVVTMAVDWPKGFVSGDGTGRIYFDPSTSGEQREALERALTGKAGGDLEGLGAVIPNWLPPSEASIEFEGSDGGARFKVGDVGEGAVEPIRNEAGEITRLLAGPVAFAEETMFGKGDGTHWSDPDMKKWESRGHGEGGEIDWSG